MSEEPPRQRRRGTGSRASSSTGRAARRPRGNRQSQPHEDDYTETGEKDVTTDLWPHGCFEAWPAPSKTESSIQHVTQGSRMQHLKSRRADPSQDNLYDCIGLIAARVLRNRKQDAAVATLRAPVTDRRPQGGDGESATATSGASSSRASSSSSGSGSEDGPDSPVSNASSKGKRTMEEEEEDTDDATPADTLPAPLLSKVMHDALAVGVSTRLDSLLRSMAATSRRSVPRRSRNKRGRRKQDRLGAEDVLDSLAMLHSGRRSEAGNDTQRADEVDGVELVARVKRNLEQKMGGRNGADLGGVDRDGPSEGASETATKAQRGPQRTTRREKRRKLDEVILLS